MNMIRHHRWIALLIGVILVCFSAISFMIQEEQAEIQGDLYNQDIVKGKEEHKFTPLLTYTIERKESFYSLLTTKQETLNIVHNTMKDPSQNTATNITEVVQVVEAQEPAVLVEPVIEVNHQLTPPKELFFTRTQMLSQIDKDQSTLQYTVTDKELQTLRKIVMAEAEGEPYEGKIAVANVVLNRLRSANFPNTIHKVIYQKYQFSPVRNGRFDRVKPSTDVIYAVNEALNGRKEVSEDTYYFLSLTLAQDLTVHHTRTFSKTIGNHSFYK
ncbi:cell wall hydrolase [Paenibacillus sp. CMAA1364]